MRIQITIDGDERENAFLKEIFEKGNVDAVARKWAEFLYKVKQEGNNIFMEEYEKEKRKKEKSPTEDAAGDCGRKRIS